MPPRPEGDRQSFYQKINPEDQWKVGGELIQLGNFQSEKFYPLIEEKIEAEEKEFSLNERIWLASEHHPLSPEEEFLNLN